MPSLVPRQRDDRPGAERDPVPWWQEDDDPCGHEAGRSPSEGPGEAPCGEPGRASRSAFNPKAQTWGVGAVTGSGSRVKRQWQTPMAMGDSVTADPDPDPCGYAGRNDPEGLLEDRLDGLPLRQRIPSSGVRRRAGTGHSAGASSSGGGGDGALAEEDVPLSVRLSRMRPSSGGSGRRQGGSSAGPYGEGGGTGGGSEAPGGRRPYFSSETPLPRFDSRGGATGTSYSLEDGAPGGEGCALMPLPGGAVQAKDQGVLPYADDASVFLEEGSFWGTAFGCDERRPDADGGGTSGPLAGKPQPRGPQQGLHGQLGRDGIASEREQTRQWQHLLQPAVHHISVVEGTPSTYGGCSETLGATDPDPLEMHPFGSNVAGSDEGCGLVVLGTTPGDPAPSVSAAAETTALAPRVSPMLPKHLTFTSPSPALWPLRGAADNAGGHATDAHRYWQPPPALQRQGRQGEVQAPAGGVQYGGEEASAHRAAPNVRGVEHVGEDACGANPGFRFATHPPPSSRNPSHGGHGDFHVAGAPEPRPLAMPPLDAPVTGSGGPREGLGLFERLCRDSRGDRGGSLEASVLGTSAHSPRVWPRAHKGPQAGGSGARGTEASGPSPVFASSSPHLPCSEGELRPHLVAERGRWPVDQARGGADGERPVSLSAAAAAAKGEATSDVEVASGWAASHLVEERGAPAGPRVGSQPGSVSMHPKRCGVRVVCLVMPPSVILRAMFRCCVCRLTLDLDPVPHDRTDLSGGPLSSRTVL